MRSINRLEKIMLVLVFPVVLVFYVAWQNLVPSGIFEIDWRPGDHNSLVDSLMPTDRVNPPKTSNNGEKVQQIIDDLAVQFVHPHRSFNTIEAEIRFKNEGAPLVEFGGLAREDGQIYDLRPLSFPLLDNLSWQKIEGDGLFLYQKTPVFSSVDEFLQNPPNLAQVAVYQAPNPKATVLPGETWNIPLTTIANGFRGFHDLRFLANDVSSHFELTIIDHNKNLGADPVDVVVLDREGNEVIRASLFDDGNILNDGTVGETRYLGFDMPSVPAGVYKMEWRASRDIEFREVKTTAKYVVFMNRIDTTYSSDPFSVYSKASNLFFETELAGGTQSVKVGDQSVDVEKPFTRNRRKVNGGELNLINAQNGQIIVGGDGSFATLAESWFVPEAIRLQPKTDLDKQQIDFVLTSYESPKEVDGWLIQKVAFSNDVLVQVKDAWKFTFSTPEMKSSKGSILLGGINWKFYREPFTWTDVWKILKGIL